MRPAKTAKSFELPRVWNWLKRAPHGTFAMRLALITLGVSIAWFTRLFNVVGIDDLLERVQLDQMEYSVVPEKLDKLKIVVIKGNDKLAEGQSDFASDQELWRGQHARLLHALARGPRLVAFDLLFAKPQDSAEYQQANAALGKAISEAKTRILVGVNWEGSELPRLIDSLKGADWGLVNTGDLRREFGGSSHALTRYCLAFSQAPAGVFSGPQPAVPSLAVMMRLAELNPSRSEPSGVLIDPGARKLILRYGKKEESISCVIDMEKAQQSPRWLAWIPFRPRYFGPDVERPYQDVLKHLSDVSEFDDKIVLIGAETDKLSREQPDERVAYGYQVHASVFSDLSQGNYPKRLNGLGEVFVLLGLGFISGMARPKLPKSEFEVDTKIAGRRKVSVGLLILFGGYLAIAWIFYRSSFILLDLAYGALAVVLSYYLCGALLEPSKEVVADEAR